MSAETGWSSGVLWVLCAAVVFSVLVNAAHADEYDALRLKWVNMLTGGARLDISDAATAATISGVTSSANGYWSSMNKAAARTSLWSDAASTTISADVNTNFSRLRSMAIAYRTTGSSLKDNAALRDDILGGLDWMYANRYNEGVRIYDNWWHFEIGGPMALADTVALMYEQMSPMQIANATGAIEKFTPSATTPAAGGSTGTFTGANRMWKIQVVVIRGVIVKDAAKLQAARDACSQLFVYVTSGDGFYVDGSFIQHGRHPYTGGYGASLLGTIAPILTLLNGPNDLSPAGSTWKVTDPNLPNVYRWVYDAYEPLVFRGGMMSMVEGREVSRSSASEHGTGHGIMQSILRISQFAPAEDRARMRAMLRAWGEADTSRSFSGTAPLGIKADVQQLMSDPTLTPRPELRGNHVFASMDRVVHLGGGFALGLSLSSARIYTYESINRENLHGWHTGDGMTYLYNGDLTHFSDSYWPTVNPRRLPGTTVDAGQARGNGSGQSTAPAPSWVGGAALGRYGAAGMQLAGWSSTLRAKKSWFMFDEEVVCLGSGIVSSDGRIIETTVENRLLDSTGSNVFTVDGTPRVAALGGMETLSAARWAHLAGRVSGADIGFVFPGAASPKALREARTGAWSDINGGGSTAPLTRNYLTLWFDHGANPTDGAYAYVLLPGRTASQTADYATRPPVTVVENSTAAHAVRHDGLGIVAANFWNDGRYTSGPLTVDRKASVVVRETNGALEFAVSDPTQANPGAIVVEFAGTATAVTAVDPGVTVVELGPTVRLSVDVGGSRGRTFRVTLATVAKPPARLSNLSTRAYVSGGEDAVIAGFVVAGSGPKKLLVRAAGPALEAFGVTGALARPRISLMAEHGAIIAENAGWNTAANAAELAALFPGVGAFAFAPNSRDAALLVSLDPGAYTALVRSAEPAGGIVLAEIYDGDLRAGSSLVNLSARVLGGSGPQSAIVGFALSGEAAGQVLIRAAGPALAAFQVSGMLPDPQLRVTDFGGGGVGQNDNWSSAPLATDIGRAAESTGAFAFKEGSKDAAALLTLTTGSYTAVVADATGASGQTLVEVYAVPR